ncbi:MAG: hypothetical protein R3E95_08780 [Thiolinea sp.]
MLKAVLKVLDTQPLFDAVTLQLLSWAASYYHHPPGEVVFAALPVALRNGQPLPGSLNTGRQYRAQRPAPSCNAPNASRNCTAGSAPR